jgi:hypothetical protein
MKEFVDLVSMSIQYSIPSSSKYGKIGFAIIKSKAILDFSFKINAEIAFLSFFLFRRLMSFVIKEFRKSGLSLPESEIILLFDK